MHLARPKFRNNEVQLTTLEKKKNYKKKKQSKEKKTTQMVIHCPQGKHCTDCT